MPSTAIVSPQIVDSTSIGRDLITAADQAAAQAIIGVTGVDVTADYNWTGNHDFSGTVDTDGISINGNLNSEVGGSYKLYNLGTEGDANTEYLETSWDTDAATISTEATGSGVKRNFYLGDSTVPKLRLTGARVEIVDGLSFAAVFDSSYSTFYGLGIKPVSNSVQECGSSSARWANVHSVDGSFSGNLNSEVGGTQRVYNLGTDGDADTEYLETSWDTNVATIETKATGSGFALRELRLVNGQTSVKLENAIVTLKANNANILRGSGTSATYLYAHSTGTILEIGNGEFKPFTGTVALGSTANRWSTIYGVDGDFSGTVTTDTINASGSTLDLQLGGSTVLKANSVFSYYYAGGGNTYILQGSNFLRPQGGAAPFDLGGSSHRWRTVFGEEGSFSGNLNTEVGGTQRVYGLGTDGDADTEYIETSWDGTTAKIQTKETGSGVLRKLDVLAGSTGMKAYANSTLILSSAWSSVWANNVQVMLYAPSGGYVSVRNGDLRPYDAVTPINCGQAAVPWAGVYSVDGSFSGNLNTEVGGSRRLYKLGTEGDTDTEFLETLYDTTYNTYSIRTGATGSGTTIRSIYIGTGFTGTNSRGLIISNSSCTFNFGGARLVVKGGTIDSHANFSPSANNLYDLGSATKRWANIYGVDGDFSGDVVMAANVDFTGLPTSDPLVAGRLWNDGGTMKISAGGASPP